MRKSNRKNTGKQCAYKVGTVGNIPTGSINRFPFTLSGIVSVTNNEPATGGFDEETDDELRDIYFEKVSLPATSGSAADSEHIVGELMKGFMHKRPVTDERIPEHLRKNLQGALPAILLPSQSAILSAFINDVEPDMMYAQLVYGYAMENDLVIGLSTSGNSKNVVNAIEVARCVGAKTLALTGEKESRLSGICDVTVRVPETETYKVQELHLPVYHFLCAQTEQFMFPDLQN